MRFAVSLAAVASLTSARFAGQPESHALASIIIEWDNDAVESWGLEYDEAYAEIQEGWADLLEQVRDQALEAKAANEDEFLGLVGPDQVDYTWNEFLEAFVQRDQALWDQFSQGATELSEKEQQLNEDMGERALEYIGQAVTVDG